jgi:tRNA-splicing ligase RtcB (3'-phosphate/5'-hydroxy nucleic acid ligase)
MKVSARILAREGVSIEDSSIAQLKDACRLPGVVEVWGMPDIHQGFGVPIGCVVALDGYVVPAAVGYDVNCGMRLMTTPLETRGLDLVAIANQIHNFIPLGEGKSNVSFSSHDFETVLSRGVSGLFDVKKSGHRVWDFWSDDEEKEVLTRIEDRGSMAGDAGKVSRTAIERGIDQLATLGGGNHFIELQEVEKVFDRKLAQRFGIFEGQFTMMIHSGSRGFGHQVGDDYMKAARRFDDEHGGGQPGNQLCFLPLDSKPGQDYLSAMNAAANFAFVNRQLMAVLAKAAVREVLGELDVRLIYDVTHNIAKFESHKGRNLLIHRKGATRAFGPKRMAGSIFSDTGQPVLIPGSMGTASYLLAGCDGSELTLSSVNHGAGRVMSRTEARGKKHRGAAVSDFEFARSMEGIYLICEDRRAIKEEAPAAYKDIDRVIESVSGAGLAAKVARLKPRAVLKG